MANILIPTAILLYIVAASMGVTLFLGTGDSSMYLTTLGYNNNTINSFMVDNSTHNIEAYTNQMHGTFQFGNTSGLEATRLDDVLGIGNIAECTFGTASITNGVLSESYSLNNLNIAPSDNIGLLIDTHTGNNLSDNGNMYYTWLFISQQNVWVQQEESGALFGLPISLTHGTKLMATNINSGLPLPNKCTVSYTYNYNNNVLTIVLNGNTVFNQIVDVGTHMPNQRPHHIRLNNLNMQVLSTGDSISGLANNSHDVWDYAGTFFGVAVWGVDNNELAWYWHILLITIWEIALILYIVIAAVHG